MAPLAAPLMSLASVPGSHGTRVLPGAAWATPGTAATMTAAAAAGATVLARILSIFVPRMSIGGCVVTCQRGRPGTLMSG